MKKLFSIMLLLVLCATLTACSGKGEAEKSTTTTTKEHTTTNEITFPTLEEKTTKKPKSDKDGADKIKALIESSFGEAELKGDLEHGSFTFTKRRDAEIVYRLEYLEQVEQRTIKKVDKFISQLEKLYPDKIEQHSYNVRQIGEGENGVDSVRYEFFYTNSQNQLLMIFADSDGTISYIDCKFTW